MGAEYTGMVTRLHHVTFFKWCNAQHEFTKNVNYHQFTYYYNLYIKKKAEDRVRVLITSKFLKNMM